MTSTPSPETRPLDLAAQALAAVLAGGPDVRTRLAVGAALATLDDVHPPRPPLPDPIRPIPAADGVRLALDHLTSAIAVAATIDEAVRAGLAARELRRLPAPQ